MNSEPAREPQGRESTLEEEPYTHGYDGFEDLTEDGPNTAGEY